MSDRWRSGIARATLTARARLLADIRAFMAGQGLLEVDTPLLAAAAPSERALACMAVGEDGYLVPSPEHALKRLLAEGAGSLYQLGHVFRAGEFGRWHQPEFTMLEWYGVNEGMNEAIERLDTLLAGLGAPPVGARRRYRDVFSSLVGLDPLEADANALRAQARALGVAPVGAAPAGGDRVFWLDLLMATIVQPMLGHQGPEIVTHFPADDAVLVASDPRDPRCALRFECFWRGVELANGASELVDARLARERMTREQQARVAQGGPVPPMDEDVLAAMTAGLPRCAGVALGVDRLLALLENRNSITAVLPFARAD
ncbi:EF-P lysine aminoacylase EpmA [Salinisphaera sp.]|uniref:EF-P lysine aminoacylase EpmA n=1 Tax=Salinisphaera sp. TaxID=1914330 RepID=UPI002D79A947|nr:EF-P lysine aminoacylase EpmA [Salinisphaera sp.]HET7315294.1 EF-P lysine aminoacylase EpmA [Salinisphaera sp.]